MSLETKILASSPDESLPLGHSGLAFTIIGKAHAQHHIGLMYLRDGVWRILHFGGNKGHYDDDEALDHFREYVWLNLEPKLNEMCRRNLARLCTSLARAREKNILPYGFSDFKDWIKEDGALPADESRSGLTCATFVLAVLDACHIDLVDFSTWPMAEPKDIEWQGTRIKWASNNQKSRASLLFAEIGNKRYKPEQVGGAGIEEMLSCSHTLAEAAGELLLKQTKLLIDPPLL